MNHVLERLVPYGYSKKHIGRVHEVAQHLSVTTPQSYEYWVNNLHVVLKNMSNTDREYWLNHIEANPDRYIWALSHLHVEFFRTAGIVDEPKQITADGTLVVWPKEAFRGGRKPMNKVDKLLKLVEERANHEHEIKLFNTAGHQEIRITIHLGDDCIELDKKEELIALLIQQRRIRINQIDKTIEAANVALNMVTLL